MELRGWGGLKWLSYYHLAIPIGVGLFGGWLALCSNLPSLKQRCRLVGWFLLGFIPLYEVLRLSLSLFFVTGPSAFTLAATFSFLGFSILRWSILVIYPGILLLFWIVAKQFGFRLDQRTYLASAGFYLGAWFFAMILNPVTGAPADAIHKVKSGNLLLFMTIGLGIPFLAPNSALKVDSKIDEVGGRR